MKREYICVFSSNNQAEAAAVERSLREKGVQCRLDINSGIDLFAMKTLSGPDELLSGTYRIMVDEKIRDEVLELLDTILKEIDENSEYRIDDSLLSTEADRESAGDPEQPADDDNIQRDNRAAAAAALIWALLPFQGFGFIPAHRMGRIISPARKGLRNRVWEFSFLLNIGVQSLLLAAIHSWLQPVFAVVLIGLIIGNFLNLGLYFLFRLPPRPILLLSLLMTIVTAGFAALPPVSG